jgi:UDP-N-acetylglucosamine 2-epimerase
LFREKNKPDWLHLAKNFNPETFQKILKYSACAVGNSSSFIRDSTFSGTPVVLVGDRQVGRERGKNLSEAVMDRGSIMGSIRDQLKVGRYMGSDIYGDGTASNRIVNILKSHNPEIQKTISYIDE